MQALTKSLPSIVKKLSMVEKIGSIIGSNQTMNCITSASFNLSSPWKYFVGKKFWYASLFVLYFFIDFIICTH